MNKISRILIAVSLSSLFLPSQVASAVADPYCFTTGLLKKTTNCSAKDTWAVVQRLTSSGNPNDTKLAIYTTLGPALININPSLLAFTDSGIAGGSCVEKELNSYLLKLVANEKTTTSIQTLVKAGKFIPMGPYGPYFKSLSKAAGDSMKAVSAIGDYSQARVAVMNIALCK